MFGITQGPLGGIQPLSGAAQLIDSLIEGSWAKFQTPRFELRNEEALVSALELMQSSSVPLADKQSLLLPLRTASLFNDVQLVTGDLFKNVTTASTILDFAKDISRLLLDGFSPPPPGEVAYSDFHPVYPNPLGYWPLRPTRYSIQRHHDLLPTPLVLRLNPFTKTAARQGQKINFPVTFCGECGSS